MGDATQDKQCSPEPTKSLLAGQARRKATWNGALALLVDTNGFLLGPFEADIGVIVGSEVTASKCLGGSAVPDAHGRGCPELYTQYGTIK